MRPGSRSPLSGASPTLAHQLLLTLQRCEALQAEVVQAQATLNSLRQELDGTRAGERRANHLAMHDALTGLPNQRLFMARLAQMLTALDVAAPGSIREASAPNVLFLDLDGFKRVNDTHGHGMGDALLRAIASRLSATVRAGDVVARIGGDEFVCLLEGPLSKLQLGRLACKLYARLSEPVQLSTAPDLTLRVSPSIGLARCPHNGTTPSELLAAADAAMYLAKRSGKRVVFASGL